MFKRLVHNVATGALAILALVWMAADARSQATSTCETPLEVEVVVLGIDSVTVDGARRTDVSAYQEIGVFLRSETAGSFTFVAFDLVEQEFEALFRREGS